MNSFQRFFSFDPKAMLLGGSPIAWGRKINWSQIVWSRKWYIIKNCSFCIISLSRMHYFKNWSQILKGNAALQPANHLWGQFFPWQVHNSQKCIFVIFWHSHLVVVSGDHVQNIVSKWWFTFQVCIVLYTRNCYFSRPIRQKVGERSSLNTEGERCYQFGWE